MLTRGKLITHPTKQKVMQQIIRDFESQLRSLSQTTDNVTSTVRLAQCLIALSERFDDSRQWMPDIRALAHETSKGQEGANIDIELI